MKKNIFILIGFAAAFILGYFVNNIIAKHCCEAPTQTAKDTIIKQTTINTNKEKSENMKLGAFSVSLSVKDLSVSKAFYENLGFTVLAGGMGQKYIIMKNENSLIGLFQGMFEGNILTFNPGWDENGKNIEPFNDVREIQKRLKSKGVKIEPEADEKTTGPGSLMTKDPDGNVILIDQHR